MNSYIERLKNRFVWKGIDGNGIYTTISIDNFAKETKKLNNIDFNKTADLYQKTKAVSEEYYNWCKQKLPYLKENELYNLKLHFIGCIGEFFFLKLFEHKNSLVISEKNKIYTFYNIRLRKIDETDFGVDLIGEVSPSTGGTHKCVFQVKFWNPNSTESVISNHICQIVHSDAIENDFINNSDDDNIFICWLGNMDQVSQWVVKNKLSRHIVFIDKDVLRKNIDKDLAFWNKLNTSFNEIENW